LETDSRRPWKLRPLDLSKTDPISLLCELAEASDEGFLAAELGESYGIPLLLLIKLGAVTHGAPLRTVTCRACHGDHPASIEFDAATGRHFHFCPEAGLVTVDDADLATLRFDPGWLVEWLVDELPIIPPVRRRALVPNRVWHLGDARCGETLLTVMLARKVSSQVALDHLASALSTIPPADLGVVVTSFPGVARQVRLPHGYEFLDLREIGRVAEDRLVLDSAKLGFWVKTIRSGPVRRQQSRSGRPSVEAEIKRIYNERRAKGLAMISTSAEAREIRAEFQKRFPDRDPPHLSTVRGHVSRVAK
jgi:hypothetical protein